MKNSNVLFADNEESDQELEGSQDGLNINKAFADKFEYNNKRIEKEKLEYKYGGNAEEYDEEPYSSSSDDDSQAKLLTNRGVDKFNQLLSQIVKKDQHLYENKGEYFNASDFDEDSAENDEAATGKKSKSKKVTYKDVERQNILKQMDKGEAKDSDEESDDDEGGENRANRSETMAAEEKRLKKEFKQQVQKYDTDHKKPMAGFGGQRQSDKSSHQDSDGDKKYDSDDDILIKKGREMDSSQDDDDEDIIEKQKLKEMNTLNMQTDADVFKQIYGEKPDLTRDDKFLVDYILNDRWKGGNQNHDDYYADYQQKQAEKGDKEDSERESEMDKFEEKYNFRFEDKQAAYLTSYARQAPDDSMRRVDDRRKQARQTIQEKKNEEKERRKEEINRLKALKREEIIEKLKKAEFIAGNMSSAADNKEGKPAGFMSDRKLLEKAEKELNTEFIPDLYDKTMDAIFDAKYYEAEDVEGKNLEKTKDIDMQILNDQFDKIGGEQEDSDSDGISGQEDMECIDSKKEKEFLKAQKERKQRKYEEQVTQSLKKQVDQKEQDQGFQTWFTCDQCFRAIDAGAFRYDSLARDNFTLCEKCYKKNTKHLDRFKKIKVAKDQRPPENADELIAQSYMLCQVCRVSLLDQNKKAYICRADYPDFDETGIATYWCKQCKDSTEHPKKREKIKNMPGLKEGDGEDEQNQEQKETYLDKLLQEYYDLDCEDVIGGGNLKTRFNYVSVPKENYGLTNEEILLMDDDLLNKYVSLKKMRPYANIDEDGNEVYTNRRQQKYLEYKLKKMRRENKEEFDLNRNLVKENQLANLNIEKEHHLGTTDQKKLSKAERRKYKQEKKIKNAKYLKKRTKKDEDGSGDEDANDDNDSNEEEEKLSDSKPSAKQEKAFKKKRRLAAFGIK